MANSTFAGMLTSAKTAIDALSLSGVTCVIRKLPVNQETVDTLPAIVVCPGDKPEEYERLAFGNVFTFSPQVQIVIITANNANETTNLTTLLDWRESIANALSDLSVGLASSIEYDVPIDRKKVAQNYDYLSLGWRAKLWA